MTFYHGTNKENWDAIQKEGILWGRRFIVDSNGKPIKEVDRCTYLATDKEEAKQYGDVVLKVEYDPLKTPKHNNYTEGCWQVRVYEPIPITDVKRCGYTLSYPDSMKILDEVDKKHKAINRIMEEMMASDMERTTKAINKALYDMAEQKHLSLYDLCFHTVPEVSGPKWDDATNTYSKTISIVPVEFDLTHDGGYWKKKYFQLKGKMQGIPGSIQKVIDKHFDEMS